MRGDSQSENRPADYSKDTPGFPEEVQEDFLAQVTPGKDVLRKEPDRLFLVRRTPSGYVREYYFPFAKTDEKGAVGRTFRTVEQLFFIYAGKKLTSLLAEKFPETQQLLVDGLIWRHGSRSVERIAVGRRDNALFVRGGFPETLDVHTDGLGQVNSVAFDPNMLAVSQELGSHLVFVDGVQFGVEDLEELFKTGEPKVKEKYGDSYALTYDDDRRLLELRRTNPSSRRPLHTAMIPRTISAEETRNELFPPQLLANPSRSHSRYDAWRSKSFLSSAGILLNK